MTEEIAFSDWSERLERSGNSSDLGEHNGPENANSWLPAYGFHQPLQQAFQDKNLEFYSNDMMDGVCTTNLLLETIMEETSDDLRSETSGSEYTSGLLTDSMSTVIHVPSYDKNLNTRNGRGLYWNGGKASEVNNDPGVQDEHDEEDDFTDEIDDSEESEEDSDDSNSNHQDGFPSRTSSLLQFENLEKHCETIFKSRKCEYGSSYENKNARTWKIKSNSQPENLHNFGDIDDDNDSSSLSSPCSSSSSEMLSSDDALSSSFGSKYSSLPRKSSIRSFRSVDSLTSLHQKREKEQDLLRSMDLSQSLTDDLARFEDHHDDAAEPAKGIYKTMECLIEIPPKTDETKETETKVRRSTENLSEDSGFGDHVVRETSGAKKHKFDETQNDAEASQNQVEQTEAEKGDESEAKISNQCWQSDPNLLDTTYVIQADETSECERKQSEDSSPAAMTSRSTVASTPNLYNADEEYHYRGSEEPPSLCNDSAVSLSQIYSLKRINFGSESKLSASSKGSNIQITTSFINLTNPNSGSNKGVHFCPVVSEVSWQESSESEEENSCTDSEEEQYSEDELKTNGYSRIEPVEEENEERDETPPIDELVQQLLSESVASTKRRESDKEKLRQAQRARLDFITSPPPKRGSVAHVMHTVVNNPSNQVTASTSHHSATLVNAMDNANGGVGSSKEKSKSSVGKLGGFFQRFSLKRLSGRKKSKKSAPPVVVGCVPKESSRFDNEEPNSRIVPLSDDGDADQAVVSSKPPLPPSAPARRRPSGDGADPAPPRSLTPLYAVEQSSQRGGDSNTTNMLRKTPYIDPNTGIGLLETDIDSNVTSSTSAVNTNNSPGNKKSRSLLNLDNGRMSIKQLTPDDRGKPTSPHHNCNDYRAKSMEFLLDKENQAAVKPPENELQKGNGEKKMSEHELRVQRSLQKLNVPEWYKNSTVPTQGFLLKRHSDVGQTAQTHQRWNASTLPSKTTSLSSLGSTLSTTPRSPTSGVLTSPSPTHYAFSRWSTSRLNSGTNSSSTSPCGSARSSFNYRQPYLGWRSQEKLSKPRTPAERLAAGLLPQYQNGSQQSSPSLTEVRSSIKEVTSAIVHYVSGTRESSDRLSPSLRLYADSSSRSTSPRGSTGRLCWLESSFVGSRPLNVPETPSAITEDKKTLKFDKEPADELYLNYPANNTQKCNENQTFSSQINGSKDETIKTFYDEYKITTPIKEPIKQNPNMATLDDILDSLLGLSTASRTPSPAKTSLDSETVGSPIRIAEDLRRSRADNDNSNNRIFFSFSAPSQAPTEHQLIPNSLLFTGKASPLKPTQWNLSQSQYEIKRRRSEGSELILQSKTTPDRRISYDVYADPVKPINPAQSNLKLVVQCRYPKCGKTAEPAEAKRSFKVCHNCDYVYCSRECRREHWEKHRKVCLHSRVGELCRRVLSTIKQNEDILLHASTIARRGFLTHGRGCVKFYFHSPQLAEQFANGAIGHPEAVYIKWTNLLPTEMGNDLYAELLRICKTYNPDTRLVIFVAVHVVSEVPTRGAVKWERQIISRCAKTKLSPALTTRNPSLCNLSKETEHPETLILTSLPGSQGTQKDRQVSFTNIQRHLRQRGVSLRKQFPEVYKKLCSYVEGNDNFTPITIYPVDSASGKNFMCVIMPDAEPEKLNLIPKENLNVQTIDVSKSKSSSEL